MFSFFILCSNYLATSQRHLRIKSDLLLQKRHCKSLSIASGDGLVQMMAALSARTTATPQTPPKFRKKSMENTRDTGR
jgi:hypothetical protein